MSAPHSCIPHAINSGETIAMTLSDGCHLSSLWTMALVLNNGLCAPTTTAATANADGRRFDVTISSAVSAGLAQGPSTAQQIFTRISDGAKEFGNAVQTTVVPSIQAIAQPTANQVALAACIATIAKLSAAGFSSTSFNGQSSTRAQLAELQKQKITLEAAVIAEQKALFAARGGRLNNGRIQTEFVGSDCWPHSAYPLAFHP